VRGHVHPSSKASLFPTSVSHTKHKHAAATHARTFLRHCDAFINQTLCTRHCTTSVLGGIQLLYWESYNFCTGSHTTSVLGVIQLLYWESYNFCTGSHTTSVRSHTTSVLGGIQLLYWESYNFCTGRHTTSVLGGIQLLYWESDEKLLRLRSTMLCTALCRVPVTLWLFCIDLKSHQHSSLLFGVCTAEPAN
jgi:hypothetical protein